MKLGEGFQTAQASIKGATGQSTKSIGELTGAFKALGTGSQDVVGSGQEMEAAYGTVAGQLKLTEGHVLSTAEATKFATAANNLAESGAANLAEAYSATAKVMQTFHLDASHAAEVTDTLYSTSKAVNVPVEQIASSMGKLHAGLGAVAPSMHDVTGMMVALGKEGLTGSRGAQVVASAFEKLLGSSKPVHETLKNLGVTLTDSNGKFIGMEKAIGLLGPKLAALPPDQRRFAEQTLLGAGATEKLGQVLLAGAGSFDKARAAANQHTAAQRAAEAQSKTFHNEMEALKHSLETLGGSLGLVLIPKLQAAAKVLAEGVQWLEKHKAAAEDLAKVITGVLGAAVAVYAEDKAVKFATATKGMLADIGNLAKGAAAASASMVRSFGTTAGAAETTAATTTTAEKEMAVGAEDTAVATDAALGSTGVGLVLVGLGFAAVELAEHWSEAMKSIEEAAQAVANAVIHELDKAIAVVEKLSLGLVHIGKIKELSGAGEGGEGGGGEGVGAKAPANAEGQWTTSRNGPTAAIRSEHTLHNLGLGSIAVQGIVKALQAETNQNLEKGAGEEGKEGAYGVAQWLGSRRAGLEAFAKAKRKPASNLETQLEYLVKELHGPEKNTLAALQHAHGVNEASNLFIKDFERPKVPSTVEQRAASEAGGAANKHLQKLMDETSGAIPKKKAAGTKAAAEAYVDPLAHARGLVHERTDMGVDFSMKAGSPIDALGAGIVTSIAKNWYKGQPLIEYQLTQGARKGQHVYAAEQINPDVSVGEHLKAGQRIGTYAASGTGIEMGFGAGGGKTLAQATTGYTEGEVTKAGQEFNKFLGSIGKGGTVLSQISKAAETAEKAEAKRLTTLEGTAKKLLGESTPRESLTSAIQSGTVPQLEKVLGVFTGGSTGKALSGLLSGAQGPLGQSTLEHSLMPTLGKSANASGPGKQFDNLVKELNATHSAALKGMAAQLVQTHRQALADLGRELYAVTQEKQAQALTAEATEAEGPHDRGSQHWPPSSCRSPRISCGPADRRDAGRGQADRRLDVGDKGADGSRGHGPSGLDADGLGHELGRSAGDQGPLEDRSRHSRRAWPVRTEPRRSEAAGAARPDDGHLRRADQSGPAGRRLSKDPAGSATRAGQDQRRASHGPRGRRRGHGAGARRRSPARRRPEDRSCARSPRRGSARHGYTPRPRRADADPGGQRDQGPAGRR